MNMVELDDLNIKFTDLRNSKVYVNTVEQSVLIQKMVFAMGGMWANGTLGIDDVLEEPRTYLMSEDLLLTYHKGNYPSRHRDILIDDILGKEDVSSDRQPFDKGTIVLVRNKDDEVWTLDRFVVRVSDCYYCVFGAYEQCIKYRGNGNLIRTTNNVK